MKNSFSTVRVRSARTFAFGVSTLALVVTGALSPAKAQVISLDVLTVVASKTSEAAIDALAAVSTIREDQIQQTMATRPSELFISTPGVGFQNRPDDPSTSINIRGLQDFGRVAVLIDGTRQNFQRTGHAANGQFYIEPLTIAGIDVVRGPVANVYGSGAIGGVVVFRTKDAQDILRPGETWAAESFGELSSNKGWSTFLNGAARIGPNIDVFVGGTYRDQKNYQDGNGNTVPNTASDTWTGTAKVTVRPSEGHTLKFGYSQLQTDYNTGQPFFAFFGPPPPLQVSSIFATGVVNQIATARWLYSRPEDRIFDWDANVYWTRTSTDQTKIDGLPPAFNGIGNIGDRRNFSIETAGFDFANTSRFDSGPIPLTHAFTIGADGFQDKVDTSGFGVVFTPSGQRTVSGAFAQLKSNYANLLEFIAALRFDQYSLEGGGFSSEGNRVSPKFTLGITPFRGFQPYVLYAEGYRAPAITETLVSGLHPIGAAPFTFLPDPSLKPEVGRTKEAGINLKYDNIFSQGDGFRGKVNAYRNDVTDFIDLFAVAPFTFGQGGILCTTAIFGCQQYQNVPNAKIAGAEFETMYDTGGWFFGVAGSHIRGYNVSSNAPLAKIPPDFITTTVGTRMLDNRLTFTVRWQAVAAKKLSQIPTQDVDGPGPSPAGPVFPPTGSFNLINIYLGYQINDNALASLGIENLLNEQYSPYMSVFANPLGAVTPLALPMPGITYKGALKVRFGS